METSACHHEGERSHGARGRSHGTGEELRGGDGPDGAAGAAEKAAEEKRLAELKIQEEAERAAQEEIRQ